MIRIPSLPLALAIGLPGRLRLKPLHEQVVVILGAWCEVGRESVTTIKPAVISTPFYNNALSTVGFQPASPLPAYHPAVGDVRLPCRRTSGTGRLGWRQRTGDDTAATIRPRVLDFGIGRLGIPLQRTGKPTGPSAVYEPRVEGNRIEGEISLHAFRVSPCAWLQTSPTAKALAGTLAVGLVWATFARRG